MATLSLASLSVVKQSFSVHILPWEVMRCVSVFSFLGRAFG